MSWKKIWILFLVCLYFLGTSMAFLIYFCLWKGDSHYLSLSILTAFFKCKRQPIFPFFREITEIKNLQEITVRMGNRYKQTIVKREIWREWETLKEMFNSFSHQGNANNTTLRIQHILSQWLRSIKWVIADAGEDMA